MICSNCGKDIPFNGQVCPHCKVNKQGDQAVNTLMQAGGCIGAIAGGFIGNLFGGFGGMLIGGFAGMILVMVIAMGEGQKIKSNLAVIEADKAAQAEASRKEEESHKIKQAVASAMATTTVVTAPIASNKADEERSMLGSGEYRRCPECAEIIRSEAKKCRFCGEVFATSEQ
jgi:hypothetical protein